MRKQFQVQMMGAVVVVMLAAGCSSSRNTGTSSTPSGKRTSSGQYPTGIILPGSTRSTEGLPPGQAKKIDGQQSAKAYAPGQRKKAGQPGKAKKGKSKGKKGKKK